MPRSFSPRGLTVVTVVGLAAISGYLWLLLNVAATASYAAWSGMLLIPVVVLLNIPLVLRAGRRDPDPRFLQLLVVAFVAKLAATAARWVMAFVLYNGSDAMSYSIEGARLAEAYRNWDFGAEIGRDFVGTGFMRVATGAVYVVTGPSFYLVWLIFSLLGFWGTYFLYRAFRIAVPDGDARRYALLLLLLPSMLFWPAGLGKEAFITFGIGLMAYGSALLLSGYRTWAVPLLLGLAATAVVRPHITAALFTALVLAWFLRKRPRPATELTPLTYLGGATVILGAGAVVASSAASFLGLDSLTVSGVDSAISDTTELTDEGGSTFTPASVRSPLDMPMAAFTVIFRPMIFEATNPQMLLAAAEGALLLGLVALSWRSLAKLPGRLRRQPYLILCIVYTIVFVYAFSNFGNFGILTRQRVQVLPFVLVFLALRAPRLTAEPETTSDREERALT
jgi:hypothetical protein